MIRVNSQGKIVSRTTQELFADWVMVIDAESSGGYDWDAFFGFYSPSTDVFYWHSGSGCSCDEWGDGLNSPADFEQSKDRNDMQRAFDRFRQELGWGPRNSIRDFVKPSV